MKKPKRGRPALDEQRKRQVFALRLTPEERIAVERVAELAGMRVTEWARTALLRAANDL